jgi:oligoribonuclease (3'-5' exoribonuclease)
MIYFSIDIETTGLNFERCQILEFGAIMEDTENPLSFEDSKKFRAIFPHQFIHGEPYALDMNKGLIEIIKDYHEINDPIEKIDFMNKNDIEPIESFADSFKDWLTDNGINTNKAINVAGKNFNGFDRRFLEKIKGWSGNIKIVQRVIDPAVLFVDWKKDKILPNLERCLKRANVDKKVNHTSIEDAWDVIQTLRRFYVK